MKNTQFYTLFVSALMSYHSYSQCNRKDYNCNGTEALFNIESGQFKKVEKQLKRASKFSKKDGASDLASQYTRIKDSKYKRYYIPMFNHKKEGNDKKSSGMFLKATQSFEKGKTLAEQNSKIEVALTEELDQKYLSFFTDILPVTEEERLAIISEKFESGNTNFENQNYESAAANFKIVVRESKMNEPKKGEASRKYNESMFRLTLKKAESALSNKDYKKAFDCSMKALKFDSTAASAKRIRDEAATEMWKNESDVSGNLASLDGAAVDEALKSIKNAKKTYYKYVDAQDIEISANELIHELKKRGAAFYLAQSGSFFTTSNYTDALSSIEKAKKYDNSEMYQSEDFLDGGGYNTTTIGTKMHDVLAQKGLDAFNDEKWNESEQEFRGAAVFKDSLLMINKANYANAVAAAMQLESNKHTFSNYQYDELRRAWSKAKSLQQKAKIYDVVNPTEKYNQARDDWNARQENLLKDIANNQDSHLNIELRREFTSIKTIDVPHTRDDHDFGGGANVTVWIKYSRNPNNMNKIQAQIFVKLIEERGHFGSKTETTYNTMTEPIDIYTIPPAYNNYTIDDDRLNEGANKFILMWNGKKMNNYHYKGIPNNMNLVEDSMKFITNVYLKWNHIEGKYEFSYKLRPKKMNIIKESIYFK